MLEESFSPHPLAEQAQACGRLTQVDGPEGPIAPVVTTGISVVREKLDYISRFAHIILAPVHAILLCIVPKKKFLELYLRRGRANPFCIVRGTAVHGVLFAGQDGDPQDSTKQQSSSRPRWVQLNTGSPIIQKKNAPNCACHLCSGAMPFKKKKKRKISMYRPHGKTRARQSFVPPCAKAMPISVSFKSDCTSRFVHRRRASMLVLESVRIRRRECHLESRVIPADDSHTLPLVEEFLQSLQP